MDGVFQWLEKILDVGDGTGYECPFASQSMHEGGICCMRLGGCKVGQTFYFTNPSSNFVLDIRCLESILANCCSQMPLASLVIDTPVP